MARTDLLLSLFREGAHGDSTMFRRALEAMVAEERDKSHGILADQLAEFLRAAPTRANGTNGASNGEARSTPALATTTRSGATRQRLTIASLTSSLSAMTTGARRRYRPAAPNASHDRPTSSGSSQRAGGCRSTIGTAGMPRCAHQAVTLPIIGQAPSSTVP